MSSCAQEFVEFALAQGALKLGEFELKSGRRSPYFFNAGAFSSGAAQARLCAFYAQTIIDAGFEFDVLFGPAYKGIPLACGTAAALHRQYQVDKPFAFNRKEVKDHGEGGRIVGAPLRGRVLVIDDVISAGTAMREALSLIAQAGAHAVGIVVSLDRQEKGAGDSPAIFEISREFRIGVASIATLNDLVGVVEKDIAYTDFLSALNDYRARYGTG